MFFVEHKNFLWEFVVPAFSCPGLSAIQEFSSLEETTWRPSGDPTLLEMYSDGRDLGMGIGLGGPR